MRTKLQNINVLIWDFDGTFYKNEPRLLEQIRKKELEVIKKYTHWTKNKVEHEFYSLYPKISPSGTKVVSMLSGVSLSHAARLCSENHLYDAFLKPDKKLHDLFSKLSMFTHFLLVNGGRKSVLHGLSLLFIDPNIFSEIITSEDMDASKPDTKGFKYIMDKTGLPANTHCMIGDREVVDLAPAKSLGMKTCLVWSDSTSMIADVTLKTVYEVKHIV